MPQFIYDSSGKITGYKTKGGADTVFPFSNVKTGTLENVAVGSTYEIDLGFEPQIFILGGSTAYNGSGNLTFSAIFVKAFSPNHYKNLNGYQQLGVTGSSPQGITIYPFSSGKVKFKAGNNWGSSVYPYWWAAV